MPLYTGSGNTYNRITDDDFQETSESLSDVYTPPTTPEVFGAAFRLENSVMSAAANETGFGTGFESVEGYDPFANDGGDIKGYELFADEFVNSKSPEESAAIKAGIDREFKDREIIESSGAMGFVAMMAAGATDPIYALTMFTGAGAIGRTGSILKTAGKIALAGGVTEIGAEAVKQQTQKTRTVQESMINIGGATILSGILGGTIAGTSKAAFNRASKKVDDVLKTDEPNVIFNGTIPQPGDDLELINAAGIQNWGVSPQARTLTSESISTKQVVTEMVETALVTKGNIRGVSAAPVGGAVETRIKMHDYKLNTAFEDLDKAYLEYRKGIPAPLRVVNDYVLRNRAGKLSPQEFRIEVGKALRRGDVHNIPQVQKVAQSFRRNLFDPLKDDAIKLKLLPKDVDVTTATSYLTRVYKVNKIISDRDRFGRIVFGWLKRTTPELKNESDEVISDIVDQIIDNITGSPSGKTPFEKVSLGRGPLKERTFNIPDKFIEDYLESDIDLVSRQYLRTMAPDIELTRQFGRTDMQDQIDQIKKEWNEIKRKAKTAKENKELDNKMKSDIRDVSAMRDMLLGNYRVPEDPNHWAIRVGRTVRDFNFLRMLGGMTLSAIPDAARLVAVNGLKPVGKGLVQLATSPKKFKLARLEAKKAAVGLDMVLNSRASSLAEVTDIYARGTTFERGVRATSDVFSKITLMAPWNASMKQFAGVITSDRLLIECINWKTGNISKNAIRRLASSGINEKYAKRIATQFQKYGEEGTLKLPQGQKWDDGRALQTFRAAVLKDVDRTIVTPGVGEKPLWASSELGKMIFQFKTFAASAHHKVLLADLQHRDASALMGFLLASALGSLTYGLKQYVAGREIETNPSTVISESLDRSGAFGYMWDINNMAEKATRGTLSVKRLWGDSKPMSRYVSRNVSGALLGPSLGTVEDVASVTGSVFAGDFTRKDLHTVRKLMPFQNLFYMRTMLNELEKKAARGLPK